ncbi:MAG: D-2-hydroxyacid dehydrogenase family protein [Janthinobacterium lividum]
MRILILDDYQRAALGLADWVRLGAQVDVLDRTPVDDDERVRQFAGYDVLVAMRERTPFSAALVRRLPDLRLLVTTGMVNAAIDLPACTAAGVTVCGAPGSKASAGATAEMAWALILALAKRLLPSAQALHEGRWQPHMAQSLAGRTLGLVGLGRLGTRMAGIGAALGMRVIAWSPNLTPERASAGGAEAVDKQTLFSTADVVSLHLVLADSTRGVVDVAALAAMQPHALLVNTARGALVDRQALLDALRDERIGGAGLDVFHTEPLAADDALLVMSNVLASPHLGYVTEDNMRAFYKNAIAAIEAWRAGAPMRVLTAPLPPNLSNG